MKFALVHVSGSRRGETEFFDCSWLTLGSASKYDLRIPTSDRWPVDPLQAEIFEHNCELHLRNWAAEAVTLVNHKPITEILLHNKDLIQLGPKGPKLRLRIRPEEYAACKLVREILQDARDVAAERGLRGGSTVWSFFGQLAYDIRKNASRTTQILVLALFIGLLGIVGGLAYYSYATQQAQERQYAALLKELRSARQTQADLEQKTAEERRRIAAALTAYEEETGRLSALVDEQRRHGASAKEIQGLTQRLTMLETERLSAEALIKRYGHSVCLLYGAYGFVEKGTVEGDPAELVEYTGTGFLVDAKGLIVTNRHIMEPWSMDSSDAEKLKAGLQPKLVKLLAYFPTRTAPYEVSVVRLSDQADVALGQLSQSPEKIAAIPIRQSARQAAAGEAVVVLGYPTGVESILARMDERVAEALIKKTGHDLHNLMEDMAQQRAVRPLATQGHIADVVPHRITYDAQTTLGGSGSPVFNDAGQVIAVNGATMTRFGAVSFGEPISRVLELFPGQETSKPQE
ncbi:MAG: trypsin-like peptidase domain-containing protein [Candidatus Binatia bacterium]